MKWRFLFAFLIGILESSSVWAGVFEFSLSVSYRETAIGEDSKSRTQSYTGSVSYFFGAQSAIELSYTNGQAFTHVEGIYDATADFTLLGADFVLSFADRKSTFQPFIKLGAVHQDKNVSLKEVGQPLEVRRSQGPAPSAGAGFKLRLSNSFAIRAGVDGWTSPLRENTSTTVDWAGRFGISFLL